MTRARAPTTYCSASTRDAGDAPGEIGDPEPSPACARTVLSLRPAALNALVIDLRADAVSEALPSTRPPRSRPSSSPTGRGRVSCSRAAGCRGIILSSASGQDDVAAIRAIVKQAALAVGRVQPRGGHASRFVGTASLVDRDQDAGADQFPRARRCAGKARHPDVAARRRLGSDRGSRSTSSARPTSLAEPLQGRRGEVPGQCRPRLRPPRCRRPAARAGRRAQQPAGCRGDVEL